MSSGSKGKSSYKNPATLTISTQGVYIGALKGYAGVGDISTADLALDEFIETVRIETQKADLSNLGHQNYRPFTVRRYGYDVGKPEANNLAYDTVSTLFLAFCQLDEGMRIFASAKYSLIDDLQSQVGNTILIDDITMGVRRLFLIDGISETESLVELTLLDVLGG